MIMVKVKDLNQKNQVNSLKRSQFCYFSRGNLYHNTKDFVVCEQVLEYESV